MDLDEAVVLAAGEGTRLRPLTKNRPKPMLLAADRPILEYVFDTLIETGFTRIITVVGYKQDRVKNHFGSTYREIPITYVQQNKQLGSGHALLQAESEVDDVFIVVNGDQIVTPNIIDELKYGVEESGDAIAKLAVIERDAIREYGVVEVNGDRITAIIENPESDIYHLLNAGVYAFSNSIFGVLERTPNINGMLDLPRAIDQMIKADEIVRAVMTDGLWIDATYPWDLLEVASELLDNNWINKPQREDGVWISDSATVHESAEFVAPVVVGEDAVIGPGAVVGPDTGVGRNVTIGANAVVQRAVLDDDTRVDGNGTLIDSVTGQSVRLGAGTDVPGGYTTVSVAGEVHADQRLGAVFADRVRVDGAVSVEPGTLIGPKAHIHAGGNIRGTIPEGAEVLS